MRAQTTSSPLAGRVLMQRLDALAKHTEVPGEITRTYLTPALKSAGEQLIAWMAEAGLDARFDAMGNVIGRREGPRKNAPTLLIGSHYDSVRNAGKYDGPYGVIAGIAAVAELQRRSIDLPFALEVIAFADEEGVRFKSTLLGSRALAGTLDTSVLQTKDDSGMSMKQVLLDFGGDPAGIRKLARKPGSALGYIELHIEQGPVLAEKNIPLGVVTAIAGASRWTIAIEGQAGHAGTVPMALRRDAATAAAEITLAVELIAQDTPGLLATVGIFMTPGGAANVIPGAVELALDIRAASDKMRKSGIAAVKDAIKAICKRRKVQASLTPTHDADAVACDAALQAHLTAAIKAEGLPVLHLASGAGHDAMAMADLCPVAMLFVRCGNGGISHDPRESMTAADAETGVRVLVAAIERLAAQHA
jgi:hydantoinase/carbamoylase family amidase